MDWAQGNAVAVGWDELLRFVDRDCDPDERLDALLAKGSFQ